MTESSTPEEISSEERGGETPKEEETLDKQVLVLRNKLNLIIVGNEIKKYWDTWLLKKSDSEDLDKVFETILSIFVQKSIDMEEFNAIKGLFEKYAEVEYPLCVVSQYWGPSDTEPHIIVKNKDSGEGENIKKIIEEDNFSQIKEMTLEKGGSIYPGSPGGNEEEEGASKLWCCLKRSLPNVNLYIFRVKTDEKRMCALCIFTTTTLDQDSKPILDQDDKPILDQDELVGFQSIADALYNPVLKRDFDKENRKKTIRATSTAITVDTFAHNIAAHSLNTLISLFGEEKEAVENSSLVEFLRYLRGKSAFWSGSLGFQTPGGIITSFYDVLTQFADNSYFLGTIAKTEEVEGVELIVNNKVVSVSTFEYGTFRYKCSEVSGEEEFYNGEDWEDFCSNFFNDNCKSHKPQDKLEQKLNEFNVFLPGRGIGLQAIYTLWENILRNVKHADTSIGIIPLKIEITEDSNKMYSLTSSLDTPTAKGEDVAENINEAIKDGIVDEKTGEPRMGGVSQMILCAGFLRGLSPIEIQQEIRKEGQDLLKVEWEKGKIKYAVKMWKGDYYVRWNKIRESIGKDPSEENIYRFRIVVMEDDDREESGIAYIERPPVRRVKKNLDELECSNTSDGKLDKEGVFKQLYGEWLKQWIYEGTFFMQYGGTIVLWKKGEEKPIIGCQEIKKNREKWECYINRLEEEKKLYVFAHPSGNDEEGRQGNLSPKEKHIGIRSHGTFAELTSKNEVYLQKNLEELIETLATKITIVDKDIYNKLQGLHNKQ